MRAPSSGINSALTAVVSQPGYLVQITAASQIFYLCSLDTESSFNSHIWVPYDVQVSGLNWTVGARRNGTLVIGDADLIWWTYAMELELQSAPVSIWQCYASAPTEGEALWSGRIGGITKGDALITCDLAIDTAVLHSPRRRTQMAIAAKYLLPAGKVIMVNGQKWVLQRKSNG